MAKEEKSEHKYAYKFGNSDKGILLSVLIGALFLTGSVGVAALDSVASGGLTTGGNAIEPVIPKATEDTSEEDSGNGTVATAATGIAVVIAIVLVSECFTWVLVFFVLTVISYIIYRLMSWLESKCKSCNCCWKPSCWACCAGKLICWVITVVRWVAFVMTIVLAIATVVVFVYCIIISIAAIFA